MTANELPDLLVGLTNYSKKRDEKADPNGYKVVSVRLREAEFISFAEHASSVGLTNNMALRIAARRIAGFLEIDAGTRSDLQEISRNISQIAGILSDLRKAVEHNNSSDLQLLNEQRVAFGNEFARLDPLLQQLLNTSRRRRDGRKILWDAMQR